jgi:prephenate dehydrogenase
VNVAVIGLGLIGGSLLRALAAAGHEVTGFDADPATRELAAEAGFAVTDTFRDADVMVLAGKETSGFAAADPALFAGCTWVLGLEPETPLGDWLTLAALCTALGARVVPTTATEHDRAVAQVSHVPHLLAAALARQLADNPLAGALAAGSFRDGTRVAATRAELTAAMCGGNAAEVEHTLQAVLGDLHHLHDLLETPDPIRALLPPLTAASDLRRAWPPRPAEGVTEMPAEAERLLALGRAGGWVAEVADDRRTVKTKRPETDRNRS